MLADKCCVPKKPQQLRGLNQNHNHEMKEIFKSTATRASCGTGPFHDFHAALLAKGMKPEMARLTLVRKIAAITLSTRTRLPAHSQDLTAWYFADICAPSATHKA
jgi:hypothetical protein